MRHAFSSLRLRLLFLAVLAAVPLSALAIENASIDRQRDADRVRTDALRYAQIVASEHQQLVEGARELLIAMTRVPAIRNRDAAACGTYLANLEQEFPQYSNLAVAGPDGQVLCRASPSAVSLSVTDRPYFQRAMQTDGFVVGEYQISRLSGAPNIIFAHPVRDDNDRPQGIVFLALNLQYLQQIARNLQLPFGATLTVADNNGTILSRYPDEGDWIGKRVPEQPIIQAMVNQPEGGVAELDGLDGIPRLYAFQSIANPLGSGDLFVSIGLLQHTAYADADERLRRNLIQLGIVSLFAVAATWWLSDRFILRRLNALARAAVRLGAGDLSARTGQDHGLSELGELSYSFDRMADSLEQRETARRHAEERSAQTASDLRAVFQALPDLYFRLTGDGTILDYLAGHSQDLYVTPQEFMGKRMQEVLPAEIGQQFAAAIGQVRDAQEIVTLEYTLALPTGEKAFEARLCPVLGAQIVVVVRDVTERIRMSAAEREQQAFVLALRDTAAALNSTLQFDQVLDRILDNVGRVAPYDLASIMLIDQRIARVVRCRGYAERGLEDWVRRAQFRVGETGGLWEMMQTGQPYCTPDTRADPTWFRYPETDWIRSHVGAPIRLKDQIIGVVTLDSEVPGFFTPVHAARLQALADQAATALENARLHDETGRRAEQLELLYKVGLALNGTLDARAQLDFLFHSATLALRADTAEYYHYDPRRKELALEFGIGETREIPDKLRQMRFALGAECGLVGWVAQTRVPLILPNVLADPRWMPMDTSIRSALWVPVVRGDRLLGVVAVFSERERAFAPADEQLLVLFANQTAIALENARLFEELQNSLAVSTRMYQLSGQILAATTFEETARLVMQTVYESFGADGVSIRLFDPQGQVQFQAGVGMAPNVYTEGQPRPDGITSQALHSDTIVVTNDPERINPRLRAAGIQSNVAIPLRGQTGPLGVLFLDSYYPQQVTEREIEILTLFANQAALALERVRLLDETHQRIAELEAVTKISTALRSAQTLDEMLPILLDEILAVLGTDAGSILLYDSEHQHLRPMVARGWFTRLGTEPVIPDGVIGHVLSTGQSHITSNLRADPVMNSSQVKWVPPDTAGACVPIRSAQGAMGVFFVTVCGPRVMTASEMHLLATVAEIAGNAIQRVRLHAQTEQRLERLAALRQIDQALNSSLDLRIALTVIVDQTIAQLGVDAVCLLRLDPATQALECAAARGMRSPPSPHARVSLSNSLAGRAALERETVCIPDLQAAGGDSRFRTQLVSEGICAYYGVPLIAKGKVKGVLEIYHRSRLEPDPEWLDFLDTLGGQAAIAIDNGELFDSLQRSNTDLALAYDTTLEGWSRALDLRDRETEGHTERVAEITVRLAHAFGMTGAELVQIRHGALLHDIGKMGIPDRILLKRGPLTDEERRVMHQHPVYAYQLLSPIPYLRPALDIPYAHHERWDGTGYPRGLKGEHIPLAARLFAVLDVWDALRSDRPYRPAWPDAKAREYICANSGTHFDPQVVSAFLQLLDGQETD